ncbi:MAG: hypothetical protein IKX25_01935 [Bacteroidales bacterium]|nr:hypothetical protein [Bacteroidales bacterium]
MKNDVLTLKDIAGFATEKNIWQLLLNLSADYNKCVPNGIDPNCIAIAGKEFLLKDNCSGKDIMAFAAPETLGNQSEAVSEASYIWTIGALTFYTITGTFIFEGKGGETQTKDTEVPRLSSAHASFELSELIRRCLNYSPTDRPKMNEIHRLATKALASPSDPQKRLTNQTGKSYAKSLIKFWPEEMVPIIFVCMMLLIPSSLFSQQRPDFDKSAIPEEMASLVLNCIDLRSPQNQVKVNKALTRDMSWTMMDELPVDKNGECSTSVAVNMFGLNDVGFSILKSHKGATNAGGRYRDGRDPRYKYSFIEITVKKNSRVRYQINGREGKQLFAIIPFEKDAQFTATIDNGESFKDEGVCYIWLKKGDDPFTLTIENKSGKNMAFALINYNSRKHE